MEPPSPIGSQRDAVSGPVSDDPLSYGVSSPTILILTRPIDDSLGDDSYAVSAYSPLYGTIYLGHPSVTES